MSYLFEDFELDPQKRLLYKSGVVRPLPAKAFSTLLLLVENRGRPVTKDDLLGKIWSDRFVEESNLTQKIFILRQILGEKRTEHRFIVTLPGEGYVFVAEVLKKGAAGGPKGTAGIQEPGNTESRAANLAYIKGRYHWNTRTVDGLKKAIAFANEVLSIDPAFAKAYVGLADSYILLASQHGHLSPREAFPKARSAARRALEISPELPEAYSSMGFIAHSFDWNWNAADNYFRRALELDPEYPTAFHWYGEALASRGEFGKAIEMLQNAAELDPLSLPITMDIAETYFYAGEYDECEIRLKRVLDINPGYARAFVIYGCLCREAGNAKKAAEYFKKAEDLCPLDPVILGELAYTYAAAGNRAAAEKILSALLAIRENRYISALDISAVCLKLGNTAAAKDWLEKAVDERDILLVWTNVIPKFKPLRKRFGAELVK